MTIVDTPQHDHGHQHGHDHDHVSATRSFVAWFASSPLRLVATAAGAVLLVDAGGTDDGAGLCIFRRCTGGYCPGCGLTRSAKHLTRGEVGAAWRDHPWLVMLAVQLLVVGAVYAGFGRLRERLNSSRFLLMVGAVNVVLIFGVWLVRLANGSIPRFF